MEGRFSVHCIHLVDLLTIHESNCEISLPNSIIVLKKKKKELACNVVTFNEPTHNVLNVHINIRRGKETFHTSSTIFSYSQV